LDEFYQKILTCRPSKVNDEKHLAQLLPALPNELANQPMSDVEIAAKGFPELSFDRKLQVLVAG
jgi:hypothetical protein